MSSDRLPAYSPDLARELRAAAGLSGEAMAEACGLLGGRQAWSKIERGREPLRAVWLLALIVAGRHPDYCSRDSAAGPTPGPSR